MLLTPDTIAIDATNIEHGFVNRVIAIGRCMTPHGFFGHFGKANALNGRRGASEVFFDKRRGKANRIEYLRAAIGLIGRDAHLGHHFEDAFAHGLDEILLNLISG